MSRDMVKMVVGFVACMVALWLLTAGGKYWGQWISDPSWRTCIVASNCGISW